MCSKHPDVSRAIVRSLKNGADASCLRQNLLKQQCLRYGMCRFLRVLHCMHFWRRSEMRLIARYRCVNYRCLVLPSRGIDELEPLGASNARKHRDFRRDGENARLKHRRAGHFNTTWQSSEVTSALALRVLDVGVWIVRHF